MIPVGKLFYRAVRKFHRDQCTRIAAAISFHVLFSTIPLIALAAAGFGLLLPETRRQLVDEAISRLPFGPGHNRELVLGAVERLREARGTLTIGGILGLAWASLGVFDATRWGLYRAWDIQPKGGLVRGKLVDVATALIAWIMLVLSLAVSSVIHVLHEQSDRVWAGTWIETLWHAAEWALPVVLTFLAIVIVYRFLPHVTHRLRDVWPSALVVTALFEIAKRLYGAYVTRMSGTSEVLGAIGGVMLFLVWTYVSSLILLFGAELTAVIERARGARVVPEPGAPVEARVGARAAGATARGARSANRIRS